ncbi:hypothetical protein HAX54_035338, partial [Datura stramonium]|nr:hypothetical protein [Datura stramonium]
MVWVQERYHSCRPAIMDQEIYHLIRCDGVLGAVADLPHEVGELWCKFSRTRAILYSK